MQQETSLLTDTKPVGSHPRSMEVRVPASTSNLGAGFDCFGLALQLYLTVRATVVPNSGELCRVRSRGTGTSRELPRGQENLIYRAMQFAAEHRGSYLPPVRLAVHNEIPLDGGMGSSGAAIVAGLILGNVLFDEGRGNTNSNETLLRQGVEFEGHPDNVAAALLGGFVTSCVKADGSVVSIKKYWPSKIKVLIVSPHASVKTKEVGAALSLHVDRADAVHNLQRAVLFTQAIDEGAYDLLWEAMQDRLHQAYRQTLVPGLTEALALPRVDGLLRLALSGSGPIVLALAEGNFDSIGKQIASCFQRNDIATTVRLLEVDNQGVQLTNSGQ